MWSSEINKPKVFGPCECCEYQNTFPSAVLGDKVSTWQDFCRQMSFTIVLSPQDILDIIFFAYFM